MEREGREALAEFEEMESIRMGFLRASRKTTQVELAEQMQVPQSSISRLENRTTAA
jgi:transcriptional regulator with XRE-family HTH domain